MNPPVLWLSGGVHAYSARAAEHAVPKFALHGPFAREAVTRAGRIRGRGTRIKSLNQFFGIFSYVCMCRVHPAPRIDP